MLAEVHEVRICCIQLVSEFSHGVVKHAGDLIEFLRLDNVPQGEPEETNPWPIGELVLAYLSADVGDQLLSGRVNLVDREFDGCIRTLIFGHDSSRIVVVLTTTLS